MKGNALCDAVPQTQSAALVMLQRTRAAASSSIAAFQPPNSLSVALLLPARLFSQMCGRAAARAQAGDWWLLSYILTSAPTVF